MATVITDSIHYQNIANKIREAKGTEETMLPSEMADKVGEVYDAGKTKKWNDFWDIYQTNGNRTSYSYAFVGSGWTDETFKPKYDINASGNGNWMFEGAKITNLKQILKDCGVVLDTGKCTSLSESFAYCNWAGFTHIPTLDTRGATTALAYTFCNDRHLVEIEKIILKDDGSQKISGSVFGNCIALEHIVFEGTIGADINLSWSTKLSHDSLMSIINHLADFSEDTSGTTHLLKIGATNIAKLTDEEIAIITQKGWTYE